MKKKLKIFIPLMLVLVMMFTACGNKNDETVTTEDIATVETVTETQEVSTSNESTTIPDEIPSETESVSETSSELTEWTEASEWTEWTETTSDTAPAESETYEAPWYDDSWMYETTETESTTVAANVFDGTYETFDFSSIPDYSGTDVIEINNDVPMFTDEQKVYNGTYINLSELDELGRCQVAMGVVGQETEPTEERGDISAVHPSGWIQKKYGNSWLYNRSHLLMFALTGLNDDPRNLITGTEYFNQKLMLGYEAMALWAVDSMNAHVVYRVTPVFDGNNLVAKGVLMEAYCIEYPEDCEFCVFVYNVADPSWGVGIDYATGESWQW